MITSTTKYDEAVVFTGNQKTDYFSCLPEDILKEITNFLTLKEATAFSLTGRKIQPIIQSILPFKNQELLEELASIDLLKKLSANIFNINVNLNEKKYDDFKKLAENLPNGSIERCQALRDAICSLLEKQPIYCAYNMLESISPFYQDMLLPIKLMQAMQINNPPQSMPSLTISNNKNENQLRTITLVLQMLEKNQLSTKRLDLSVENMPLDEKTLNLLLAAIQKNQSIENVCLEMENWNPLYLNKILEAIKNNKRITYIFIEELKLEDFFKCKEDNSDLIHIRKMNEIIQEKFNNCANAIYRDDESTWRIFLSKDI